MERGNGPPSPGSAPRKRSRLLPRIRRILPPARLLWLLLLVIGVYGTWYLGGIGLDSLLVLPAVAVVVDLAFQRARFPTLRAPDAAIATGLFVALLLPPVVPLEFAGAAVLAGVSARHLLRLRGRPWFNPTVVAVAFGTVAFGLAPAWWVGIGPFGFYLMLGLGILLILRTPTSWRFPAFFLLTYGLLAGVEHLFSGATTDPQVLFLQVVDPATLFFVLFMVPEPRSAPAELRAQVLYAATAGIAAAFLPWVLPTLGILVALLVANALALVLRWRGAESRSVPSASRRSRSTRARATGVAAGNRWPVGYRVGAGLFIVAILVGVGATTPIEHSSLPILTAPNPGGGGGGGGSLTACATDNPTIPAATLASLHKALGPSVILSFDSSTGVVVFYDPVNHVTVTESDLYEDYGFAEFNGDDYAVSGCAP
jgi:Na+-translocating ferredoxin:NAD+ oxidoreductase RnfD subunit